VADIAATIAQNLADVEGRLAEAASGRSVQLVCVTKYARDEWIGSLLAAGATNLGENLLPGAETRFDAWQSQYGPFERHLLGPQQSRKAKLIPASCELFQALDRHEIASLLDTILEPTGQRLDVLIQVNIDAEPQKHGFAVNEMEAATLAIASSEPNLNLRGLMTIPKPRQVGEPTAEFERRTRQAYSTMAQLFAKIKVSLPAAACWDTLSMGMSQDFTWAIEEGATMVRVGSALFAGLEG
jgi:pyridoxal phosphate enzyme (YggS family)